MLRLVYRSYGGQNLKNRPPWYSKELGLRSFLRAVEQVRDRVDVLFVNDGPMPDHMVEMMRPYGRVMELPGPVGMRRSYAFGLRLPTFMQWPDEDLVWFSEDDYLYDREAFAKLIRAGELIPEADYFALYGGIDLDDAEDLGMLPRNWSMPEPVDVDGHQWRRILSTASTFGARAGALREDWGIFKLCMVPHKNMYRDHDTAVAIQGFEPHKYGTLLRQALFAGEGSAKDKVRGAVLTPFLLATNARSHRRPERRRLFVASYPCLATHMEIDKLPPLVDWAQLAKEVDEWPGPGAQQPPAAAEAPQANARQGR